MKQLKTKQMNARQAVEQGKLEVKWLIEGARRVADRLELTMIEAIDYRCDIQIKHSTSVNEMAAIDIRRELAKNQIKN